MRRFWLLLFLPLVGVHAEPTDLVISELHPDPVDREFIELWNAGGAPVDLAGYAIEDAAGNRFTFGAWTVPAGGRVVVWGGGESSSLGPAWSRSAVWNNAGDTARLLAPDDTVLDTFSYGSHGGPAAPATGQSLHLHDGWVEANPTPGSGLQGGGASVTATVGNAPPTLNLEVPERSRPSEAIVATLNVVEPNGDAVTWWLESAGARLAHGTGSGTHDVLVAAPETDQTWLLQAFADDGANVTSVAAAVEVRGSDLVVVVPANGIQFPAMLPGDRNVTSSPFVLRNDGAQELSPRIDVSDLAGPGIIAVTGNLEVGVGGQWISYDGPLTPLPELLPGEVEVRFRIVEVPTPLPAGDYGTSFTVVA